MKLFVVLLVLCTSHIQVYSQICAVSETCQACYAIPGCAWCTDDDIQARCFSANSPNLCPAESTQNKAGSVSLDELELSSDNQISISKATVRLRAGETRSFQFNVRAAENFPLDMYMLFDLSFSLLDDLQTIKSISTDLADAIQGISSRFQVGFGSFVDKLSFPYVSPFSSTLPFFVTEMGQASSCSNNDVCDAPFNYVHNTNLTNNATIFTERLDSLVISTNADNPEGTFDAMAQAVLCQDIVGFRDNSRKIIVVITDATIHMAGDGYLAGIVNPSPMECKTVFDPSRGIYTYVDSLKYDYPSLEQIRQLFEQNLVSPIFAVLESVREYYDILSEVMSDSGAQTVTVTSDSSDLIEALTFAYENIVSEVRLSFNPGNDDIIINHSVTCPPLTTAEPDGRTCTNVSTNQTITFNVDVTLQNCTQDGTRSVTVNVPGYGRFLIEIEGICSCDCETMGVVSSMGCSGNGTFACGICNCDEGWSGDVCNCRTDDIDSLTCLLGENGMECSGRGDCLCGDCQCRLVDLFTTRVDDGVKFYDVQDSEVEGVATLIESPLIYGNSCQCDNFLCDRNMEGLVCSGNQGNCTCSGNCECGNIEFGNLSYTGIACQCNKAFCFDQTLEYDPNAQECNGNGICDECNPEVPCNCETGFIAPYCILSQLALRQCFGSGSLDRTCVECIADNDDYRTACSSCFRSSKIVYTKVMSVPNDFQIEGSQNESTTDCSFTTADPICTYNYYVAIGQESTATNQIQLVAVEPKSNCFPLRWWHIAIILLGSLIVFGIIILIIVKVIFMILDYKEVKHLDKSVAETDLSKNFNPLYQSPEVKYDNVAFGKE